ncbi:MAG: adenosylcobinamide-phosphate synthase CbiB [Phocaeicola sp.]|uniref:adenosylcobinamide-phosphate synthase CbiB n=1 Tax=Phocaeicola TaxID=909656 RepID=UPI00234F00E5|nr:adenosylcobinamide-phosphate synthase CbiB [Phocaeicola oris]MCE2616527.1 adenosylcobinamide-phosphate synthase CbiB [Phocaeicola oris]
MIPTLLYIVIPFFIAWMLDLLLGDPACMPHPVVYFGKLISYGECRFNKGSHRKRKGALVAVALVLFVYLATRLFFHFCGIAIENHGYLSVSYFVYLFFSIYFIFSCLAGTTLIREVREVFFALDRSLDAGRTQVARIVGRDTSQLSAQEVRAAALETLSENLSDGVIAPMFWYLLLGVPGMMAYKMVNTLDSMIGYHTERYIDFGCVAARMDDVVNYIPARITAFLMVLGNGIIYPSNAHIVQHLKFVMKYGWKHASPNSGYPESALAGILNCRFGGPHYYFGEYFSKPYIGEHERELTTDDMRIAVRVNRISEVLMVIIVLIRYMGM